MTTNVYPAAIKRRLNEYLCRFYERSNWQIRTDMDRPDQFTLIGSARIQDVAHAYHTAWKDRP